MLENLNKQNYFTINFDKHNTCVAKGALQKEEVIDVNEPCFIQREGATPPNIDFALPEFGVLAFETMDLPSRKSFSPSRKKPR
jgi:hypothetical protein